jgi:hypothetical protein
MEIEEENVVKTPNTVQRSIHEHAILCDTYFVSAAEMNE